MPLYLKNGKLLVSGGKLAAGANCCNCCDNVLVIIVYNSNSALDDNMEVKLNGTSLGTIDNSTNTCTGRVFYVVVTADAGPGVTANRLKATCGGPIACGTTNFEAAQSFAAGLLINGANALRIESTNDANNGNFGTVWVGCVTWNEAAGCYNANKVLLNSSYSHAEGPPNATVLSFNYAT
jgi:hypothetical protein